MTIHVQSSGSTPLPNQLAITLLPSDTYSIGGVSKTFAECFTTDFRTGEWAIMGIIEDEGFAIDFVGGGTGTGASGTIDATEDLNDAIHPQLGMTGVFDVTAVMTDPGVNIIAIAAVYDGAGSYLTFGIRDNAFVIKTTVPDFEVDGPPIVSGQTYRIAFSASEHYCAMSVNGSDPITLDPSMDMTDMELQIFLEMDAGAVGSSVRIGNARYYPLVTSSNGLKHLST